MSEKKTIRKDQTLPVQSQFLLYQTEDGKTRIEVRLQDETVWMTQAAMAELYQITPQNITTHLKAIYNEGELEALATCKEYLQVQQEGSRRVTRTRKFYNLPAVIAVGYRVRSYRGTQFRRWATERLNEYLERLENNRRVPKQSRMTIAWNYWTMKTGMMNRMMMKAPCPGGTRPKGRDNPPVHC